MDSNKQPIVDKDANDNEEDHIIPPFNHAVSMNLGRMSVPVQSSLESTDLPEIKVYKRRWYILGLFGLLACHQCIVWNTFGPIECGAVRLSLVRFPGSNVGKLGMYYVCHLCRPIV